jgi:hypothetical protein
MAVLDRVEIDIIKVRYVIGVVAERLLPEAALPEAVSAVVELMPSAIPTGAGDDAIRPWSRDLGGEAIRHR